MLWIRLYFNDTETFYFIFMVFYLFYNYDLDYYELDKTGYYPDATTLGMYFDIYTVQAVPLPAPILLFLSGIALLAGFKRRRNS